MPRNEIIMDPADLLLHFYRDFHLCTVEFAYKVTPAGLAKGALINELTLWTNLPKNTRYEVKQLYICL